MEGKKILISESLRDDIFLVPMESDSYLVYSPLRRRLFSVNANAAKYVSLFMQGHEISFEDEKLLPLFEHLSELNATSPENPIDNREIYGRTLTIILSQICNMACVYCYAQNAHSNLVMSAEKVKQFIDFCFEKNNGNIERVVFIGGGEPMVTWSQLKEAILYVKEKDANISCSIVTNGTLLDEEKCKFISLYNVGIVLSFDILPSVQRIQRPLRGLDSYEIVSRNIRLMEKHGIICKGFRSTITMMNVEKMVQMVKHVIEKYQQVKAINLEPVTESGLSNDFYKLFVTYFMQAYELGKEHNINVYCSFSLSLGVLKYRFCQRELCLTPTGEIVSCHRNSSLKDQYFEYFKIGHVNENTTSLEDYDKMSSRKERPSSCDVCFAKWHCAGGCVDTRMKLTSIENEDRCSFVRLLLSLLLYAKLKE